MLSAGVIGMGVGEKHAAVYQKHAHSVLKSICDFDAQKLERLKQYFADVDTYENDLSILQDAQIDIVSIASYDNYHAIQILEALKTGKHIMAEKPLCQSMQQMVKIHELHKRMANVKISSNLVLRANSRFRKFRNDIRGGRFGDIFFIEGDYYWGRIEKLFGWRAEMDFYSIIMGAAIHMIDLVMWLLDQRPISVQATGNDVMTRGSKLRFNSFATVLLQFEDGMIAKLGGMGGGSHPHFHGLKIFGTESMAVHDLLGAYYLDTNKEGAGAVPIKISHPYPEKETREKVLHSFIDSILDPNIAPLVPQQDVYDVMSVCFAAEEAMNSGNSTLVNYID